LQNEKLKNRYEISLVFNTLPKKLNKVVSLAGKQLQSIDFK